MTSAKRPAPPARPPSATRGDLWLIRAVLAGSAVYAVIYLALWIPEFTGRNDFFVFWSAATLEAPGDTPETLYRPEAFRAYQDRLFGETSSAFSPYAYPPTFLLLTGSLNALTLTTAMIIFLGVTLGLVLAATAYCGAGTRALSLALSPASLLNVVIGQAAFLTAALLLAGLRLATSRPWAAGAAFAVLTVKPQLGLLVPVVLVAGRFWRVFAAAVFFSLAFVGLSVAIDGAPLWIAWINALLNFSIEAERNASTLPLMVSPAGVLLALDAPKAAAYGVQALCSLTVCVATYAVVRRYALTPLTIAFVAAGTLLATPYGLFYDLVLVAAATVILTGEAIKSGFRPGERVVTVWAWLLPPVTAAGIAAANVLAPLIVGALLFTIYRRLAEEDHGSG